MSFELVNILPILSQSTTVHRAADGTDVHIVRNFFTHTECEALIAEGIQYLEPSRVGGPNDTTKIDKTVRSSSTAMLSEVSQHPAVLEAIRRIDDAYGYPHLFSNPLQLNRYQVGEEFVAHHDWHDPVRQHDRIQREGQRTWTFLMYLNDDFEGGQTEFPLMNLTVTPERGMLVLWNNLLVDGSVNETTLHASKPVTSGTKFMMTKWFKNKVL